jgi:hypothetical protein
MALDEELRRIAETAVTYCRDGEELAGIIPAEPAIGVRLYVCAYRHGEETSWLVLSSDASPIEDRGLVDDAVSIAALCEVAEDAAGSAPDTPRIASPALLDELGATAGPEVAAAVRTTADTVTELLGDVQRGYKRPLR